MHSLGVDVTLSNWQIAWIRARSSFEIARTLHADAQLFILDEPTTALNSAEIAKLLI